ncbi:MAG: acetyl-CoA carboxylase biotin carboxylase subunit [Alphaproteobacteria bacterium]|jgi:3-methylcrotonyl-CoA carboxylase alpha subunit
MFRTLLIANRGEIACRIARTAHAMGVRTIAVYSEADRDALHVQSCDEAICIGPAGVAESYLNIPNIIAAAKKTGAEAIHPGYGFLSENAAFANAVVEAGMIFVGPPANAISSMGSKSGAKELLEPAGVPMVPGYHGKNQDPAFLQEQAVQIGFPVLIKAVAGGGGRGMRIVESAGEFVKQLETAQREATAAFGDGTVLLEKYLAKARHVEVQVFADMHGQVVHLFERDCSIQRRHQKVVEEAPAPGISSETSAAIGQAAVQAAQAIDYVGAGTCEFLMDADERFYFIEMNTRLQVEHPVTEWITNTDLVEWQLRVANGEPLPLSQDDIRVHGHAIEVRIYAEDPARGFLPQTGRLDVLKFPEHDGFVRVDTGVVEGDEVSPHYDPMIAKLVVRGENRAQAVARLRSALADTQIAGVTTNRAFLHAVARHPAFAAGDVHTGFIEQHSADLHAEAAAPGDEVIAAAVLSLLDARREEADAKAALTADRYSPWNSTSGWRLNEQIHETVELDWGETRFSIEVAYRGAEYHMTLPSGPAHTRVVHREPGRLGVEIGGRRFNVGTHAKGGQVTIMARRGTYHFQIHDPGAAAMGADATGGKLSAPMPGKVTAVHVAAGAKVKKGAPLLVLEAMKMEHTITAPADGTVTALRCGEGDQVEEGIELVAFEAA